jgi:hypothetical protein
MSENATPLGMLISVFVLWYVIRGIYFLLRWMFGYGDDQDNKIDVNDNNYVDYVGNLDHEIDWNDVVMNFSVIMEKAKIVASESDLPDRIEIVRYSLKRAMKDPIYQGSEFIVNNAIYYLDHNVISDDAYIKYGRDILMAWELLEDGNINDAYNVLEDIPSEYKKMFKVYELDEK